MQLEARECQPSPGAGKGNGRDGPLEPRREHSPTNTLISAQWFPTSGLENSGAIIFVIFSHQVW